MREFEHEATWWLPQAPANRVRGRIHYTPDLGIVLESGHFEDRREGTAAWNAFPTVIGETSSGWPLSAHGVVPTKWTADRSIFSVEQFAYGAQLPSIAGAAVRSVAASYSGLEHWVSRRPFAPNGRDGIKMVPLAPLTVESPGGPRWTLEAWPNYEATNQSATLTLRASSRLEFPSQIPLDSALEWLDDLGDLLFLLGVRPGVIGGVMLTLDDERPCELCFVPRHSRAVGIGNSEAALEAVRGGLGAILTAWTDKRIHLRNGLQFYRTCALYADLFAEYRFMSVLQGLESVHRRFLPGTYLGLDEYAKVREALAGAIPETVPPSLKESLRNKIRFGNEVSLRRRLGDLVRIMNAELAEEVLGNAASFVEKCAKTRNNFVHDIHPREEGVFSTEGLFFATAKLLLLLKTVLLTKCGMSPALVSDVVRNDPAFEAATAASSNESSP